MTRDRLEFSVKVKKAAYERAGGICECGCGMPFGKKRPEFDHIVPDYHGGKNDLENCRVILPDCHKLKTKSDIKAISKTRRIINKQRGIERKKAVIPGSKKSKWKHKIDGTWVLRETGYIPKGIK